MELLISSILVASIVSTIFWGLSGWSVRPLVRGQPYLHLVTIYLSVLSFLLLNAFTFSAIFRWLDRNGISLLFGFMSGLQAVAAISAYLFVRKTARLRR